MCVPDLVLVLFLCPHGGAKSLVAATYFNELAAQRGLAITATAAATEDPYDAVPPFVVGALGCEVADFKPRRVSATDLELASRVVAIDCDPRKLSARAERWDDVPKMSEDLEGSMAAIRRHVEELVEEMGSGRKRK